MSEAEQVEVIKPRVTANMERYNRVNNAWPKQVPALSWNEARIAAKRLWRIATNGEPWPTYRAVKGNRITARFVPMPIKKTSGRRWTEFRDCTLFINPETGWHDLVHTISHRAYRHNYKAAQGPFEPHGTAHASLEHALIQEVIRRGWLDGKLRRPEKPTVAKPAPDIKAQRHARVLARLASWEKKRKRAETAIKKLKRQASYYQRVIGVA